MKLAVFLLFIVGAVAVAGKAIPPPEVLEERQAEPVKRYERPGDDDSSLPPADEPTPALRGADEPKKAKKSYYSSFKKTMGTSYKYMKKGMAKAGKFMKEALGKLGKHVEHVNKKAIEWGEKHGPKAIEKIGKLYDDFDKKLSDMILGESIADDSDEGADGSDKVDDGSDKGSDGSDKGSDGSDKGSDGSDGSDTGKDEPFKMVEAQKTYRL